LVSILTFISALNFRLILVSKNLESISLLSHPSESISALAAKSLWTRLSLTKSVNLTTSLLQRRSYLVNVKPISLNEAYATMQGKDKKGSWKNKVWRRKTSQAWEYQYLIQDTMAYQDQKYGEKFQILPAHQMVGIALTMVFFIPPQELRVIDGSKFKGRDVSNYIKLLEDAVFEYLTRQDGGTYPVEKARIEDSSSLEPLAFKRSSWDDDWHIKFYLSYISIDYPVYHAGQMIDPYESNS
jgi:hypothetical protein